MFYFVTRYVVQAFKHAIKGNSRNQEEFENWIENNGDKKRLTFSGQEVSWSETKEQASL